MVAVVGPSFSRSKEVLESEAAECYNRTDSRECLLPPRLFIQVLERVEVS